MTVFQYIFRLWTEVSTHSNPLIEAFLCPVTHVLSQLNERQGLLHTRLWSPVNMKTSILSWGCFIPFLSCFRVHSPPPRCFQARLLVTNFFIHTLWIVGNSLRQGLQRSRLMESGCKGLKESPQSLAELLLGRCHVIDLTPFYSDRSIVPQMLHEFDCPLFQQRKTHCSDDAFVRQFTLQF